MTPAKTRAISIPFGPPKPRPASMSRSVIAVRRNAVLKILLDISRLTLSFSRLDARGAGLARVGAHSCPPPLTLFVFFRRSARSLPLPLQSAFESLIQSGSRFFVFLGRDFA